MSNFWSDAFSSFPFTPEAITKRVRGMDIRNKVTLALGKFYMQTVRLLNNKPAEKELTEKMNTEISNLRDSLRTEYQKIDADKEVTGLDPLMKMGEDLFRQSQKVAVQSNPAFSEELKEIQTALDGLWQNFFDLEAENTAAFDFLLHDFHLEICSILEILPEYRKEASKENMGADPHEDPTPYPDFSEAETEKKKVTT